jgi:hypothetical protein
VKRSQDGGWGLFQSYKKGRTYHEAIDYWAKQHKGKRVVYCLVQFHNANLGDMPRVYLASLSDIVKQAKNQRGGHGCTSLREVYHWAGGIAKGANDEIPTGWEFSQERIEEMLDHFG